MDTEWLIHPKIASLLNHRWTFQPFHIHYPSYPALSEDQIRFHRPCIVGCRILSVLRKLSNKDLFRMSEKWRKGRMDHIPYHPLTNTEGISTHTKPYLSIIMKCKVHKGGFWWRIHHGFDLKGGIRLFKSSRIQLTPHFSGGLCSLVISWGKQKETQGQRTKEW